MLTTDDATKPYRASRQYNAVCITVAIDVEKWPLAYSVLVANEVRSTPGLKNWAIRLLSAVDLICLDFRNPFRSTEQIGRNVVQVSNSALDVAEATGLQV